MLLQDASYYNNKRNIVKKHSETAEKKATMASYDPPAKNSPPEIVYGDDDTVQTDVTTGLNEPLLSVSKHMDYDDEEDLAMREGSMNWSKYYSLVIGLIIGCFIQFSSLGANFLMTSVYGYNVFYMQEFVVVSLVWCFITSIMGVCVLLFLRSLVVTSFYATTAVNDTFKSKEEFVGSMIQQMEYYFAVGSLIGVCSSWTITDVLLGMRAHVLHSIVTLGVALFWCRLVMKFCGSKNSPAARKVIVTEEDHA